MATYVEWPIETDPGTLAQDAYVWLQDRWPGWVPSPANFDAGTIEVHARMIAEARDIAANVPDAIFRRYAQIAGLPSIDATAATATATVVAVDSLGYTLEAGTVLGLRATGDLLVLFEVVDDVVIPPASSSTGTGEVQLIAQESGAVGNGFPPTTALTPVDRTLPWFSAATLTTPTAGGADAESDGAYLDRLTTELRLAAPRPILPEDFSAFATNDLAVERAITLDLYVPGVNEQQTLVLNATGGTLSVNIAGGVSSAFAWNAANSALTTALEASSGVAPGDVKVTGGPLPALVTIEFTGNLAEQNAAAITTNTNSLTGGTATPTYATTVPGVAAQTGVEKSETTYVVDAAGLDPGQTARDRVQADLQSRREVNFVPYVRAPAYMAVSVTYEATCYPTWDPADVLARANEAVATWLSPATFGLPQGADAGGWNVETSVRVADLVEVLKFVDGLWHLTGPGANGIPQLNGVSADLPLVGGGVVLPIPGTITGTVVAG